MQQLALRLSAMNGTATHLEAKHWLESQLGRAVTIDEFLSYFGISRPQWYEGHRLRDDPNWLTPNMAYHCAERLGIHPGKALYDLGLWPDAPKADERPFVARATGTPGQRRRARTDTPRNF